MKIKEITEELFGDYTTRMYRILGEFLSRVVGEVNFRSIYSITFIANSSKECEIRDYFHRSPKDKFKTKCLTRADYVIVFYTQNNKMFSKYYCESCLHNILINPIEKFIKELKKI